MSFLFYFYLTLVLTIIENLWYKGYIVLGEPYWESLPFIVIPTIIFNPVIVVGKRVWSPLSFSTFPPEILLIHHFHRPSLIDHCPSDTGVNTTIFIAFITIIITIVNLYDSHHHHHLHHHYCEILLITPLSSSAIINSSNSSKSSADKIHFKLKGLWCT